jgi:hypothetical protein
MTLDTQHITAAVYLMVPLAGMEPGLSQRGGQAGGEMGFGTVV